MRHPPFIVENKLQKNIVGRKPTQKIAFMRYMVFILLTI